MCTNGGIDLYVSKREGPLVMCDEAPLSATHCDLAWASNSLEEVGLMTTKEFSLQEIGEEGVMATYATLALPFSFECLECWYLKI